MNFNPQPASTTNNKSRKGFDGDPQKGKNKNRIINLKSPFQKRK